MTKNIEGTPIKCRSCGYEWLTQSTKIWVSCPNCLNKNRVPKEEK